MKIIVCSKADGSVSIIKPAPKERVALVLPEVANMTEDEFFDFVKTKDAPPDTVSSSVVEHTDLPSDMSHRNEWTFDSVTKKVKEDSVKIQAKLDKKSQDESEFEAVLSKLKITKEEYEKIIGAKVG